MANRYGALTLQLKQLSNLANIGSAYTTVLTASGTQKISEGGQGSFTIPRDYSTINAIDSNVGQVAYVYITDQVASGAAMDVATFIITGIDKETDQSGLTVTVSGIGLENQLTYADLDDDTIDNGAGGKDTSDVDTIMGYAPSGWTYDINGGAGTGSSNGSYFTSRGNNVLQLLIAATKQNSGNFFRLSSYSAPAKTISWRTTSDSSGVTLRMPSNPITYDGSTATGIILNMSEDASFEDVVTRIRPYGAGLDDGRLDITNIDSGDTGGDPSGYTTTFASNLIVNTALETSLGYSIKRDIDFSRNRPADVSNATQLTTAAVALWNEGITYLEERDSSKKFYRIQCVVARDLRPGQTVSVVYTEYEGGITGGNALWTVNDSFYIHEVTNSVSNSGNLAGVRVTNLTVSNTLAPKATGERMMANAIQSMRETTRKSSALTTPGAVSTSTIISTALPLTGGGDLSANRTHALGTLNSYGSANQVLGANAAANDIEYKTLTGGTGISIGHSAGAVTITNTGQTTSLASVPFVTIGNTASLSGERALTAGDGLDLTDGGANSTATLAIDVTDILGAGLTETANNIVLGTPTTLTVSTTNTVSGTTHAHAITSSSSVTSATAVIMATDSNGRHRLQGLGVGAAAAADNWVIVPTAGGIGLASSGAGRIVFTDTTTDQIELLTSHVLVNGSTPDSNTVGTPASRLTVIDGRLGVSSSANDAALFAYAYGTSAQGGLVLRGARGTRTTPTATQSDDNIGRVGAGGHTGSAFVSSAATFLQFKATENWTGSANGARAEIHITPAGSTTSQRAFLADENGARIVGRLELLETSGLTGIEATTSSNSNTNYSIDFPDVTTAIARVRFFNSTSTTGTREIVVFRGDGSSTRDHTFTANGGYLSGGATGGDKGVGTINISADYYRGGTKVVGARVTGWGAPTGTATRTAFATGSVTLAQLAERVKALVDDLTTHGLIGA